MTTEKLMETIEELRRISNKGYEPEIGFDYDNPPRFNMDVPDSFIPPEAIDKALEIRKLILEIKDIAQPMDSDVTDKAHALASSSPYAQIQWIFFHENLDSAILAVNTLLRTHEKGENNPKTTIDRMADSHGITPEEVKNIILRGKLRDILSGK